MLRTRWLYRLRRKGRGQQKLCIPREPVQPLTPAFKASGPDDAGNPLASFHKFPNQRRPNADEQC
eukprot:229511-Pelagomonas_calceolata.AAC.2